VDQASYFVRRKGLDGTTSFPEIQNVLVCSVQAFGPLTLGSGACQTFAENPRAAPVDHCKAGPEVDDRRVGFEFAVGF
jgi:hypothetical protein